MPSNRRQQQLHYRHHRELRMDKERMAERNVIVAQMIYRIQLITATRQQRLNWAGRRQGNVMKAVSYRNVCNLEGSERRCVIYNYFLCIFLAGCTKV